MLVPSYQPNNMLPQGFLYIGSRAKKISLSDGFVENPIDNVHIEGNSLFISVNTP